MKRYMCFRNRNGNPEAISLSSPIGDNTLADCDSVVFLNSCSTADAVKNYLLLGN